MGLCGSSDLIVKDGIDSNLTYDMMGNQLDNSEIYSNKSISKYRAIKTYNCNKILEFEIEAFIGEREYPIYISKKSKIEINILEDNNYLWSFLPEEKKIDYKGYSNYKYNDKNLGCLLIRISSSHQYFQVNSNKFKFTSENEGSLIISANLDIDNYLSYEPKGSLKLMIQGGEICDMKKLDELTKYNLKPINYKKKESKAYSEIYLNILRYINKARYNIEKYINDFIIDYDSSLIEEFSNFNKNLSPFEIDIKLYKIAEEHCKDLGKNGTSGHIGTDGTSLKNRFENHKIKTKDYAECIIYGYDNPISICNFLIVNKYSKNKKERKILLNNKYKKIGISLNEHICYGHCCVIIFAE